MNCMNCGIKQKILQLDARVPRYTSYPTAPHFCEIEQGKNEYESALESLPKEEPLSLYLHIPFCPRLCWYCGCNTKITQRYAPVEDYVHLLLREIDIAAEKLAQPKSVSTIHFGGGSPSYLRAVDFDLIMQRLRKHFILTEQTEIAIEVDPRNISEGRVAAYAKNGVNRISLGVQDFDGRVLASVNRPQPFHLSYEAVRLMRAYGIQNINLDLIYGLPHQTPESMKRTIALAMTLEPSRLALFGYAHVPWMKKHMRLIEEGALPDKDLRYDLFETASRELVGNGFDMVGIDHFARADDPLCIAAKTGMLRRNFQGYTTDRAEDLIGLGVSSIGKVGDMYVQNAPDMPGYKSAVLDGKLPVRKYCLVRREDKLRADIIERLMCDFKADMRQICMRHGFEISHFQGEIERLKSYKALGFLTMEDDIVRLKPEARLMARNICAVFDMYLPQNPDQPRHAQAI